MAETKEEMENRVSENLRRRSDAAFRRLRRRKEEDAARGPRKSADKTINLDSTKRKLDKASDSGLTFTPAQKDILARTALEDAGLSGFSPSEIKNALGDSIDPTKNPKDILSSVDLKQNISTGKIVPTESKLLVGLDGNIGLADVEAGGEPNEVNVPRLARGIKEGTLYEDQEKHKTLILSTLKGKTDVPESPYAAQYPYNLVEKSESGHIREVDDTPGAQRLKEMHRSGTYYEIYPDGTKVTKVMKDNFSVTVGEDYTKIEGVCIVHVAGKAELFCQDEIRIETAKAVNLISKGDVDIISALGSVNITGTADVSVGTKGLCKIGSSTQVEITGGSIGTVDISSGLATSVVGDQYLSLESNYIKITDKLGDINALRLKDKALDLKNTLQDAIIATKQTSDRALKKDIIRVGASPSGIPTYNFKFIGDITRSVYYGVMAQDIQESHPSAVSKGKNGYLLVDYSLIDVDYQRVS
jgi:hypothetical protein